MKNKDKVYEAIQKPSKFSNIFILKNFRLKGNFVSFKPRGRPEL